MKRTLCVLVMALCGKANARGIEFDPSVNQTEREVSVTRRWMSGEEDFDGVSVGVSNIKRDYWFDLGVYVSDEKIEVKQNLSSIDTMKSRTMRLFPRFSYSPARYCFFGCDKRWYRMAIEPNIGAGVFVDITKTSYPSRLYGLSTQGERELRLVSIDANADVVISAETKLRLGILEGNYTITGEEDKIRHILGAGFRF